MKQEDFYQPSFMKVIAPVTLKFFSFFFGAGGVFELAILAAVLFIHEQDEISNIYFLFRYKPWL